MGLPRAGSRGPERAYEEFMNGDALKRRIHSCRVLRLGVTLRYMTLEDPMLCLDIMSLPSLDMRIVPQRCV